MGSGPEAEGTTSIWGSGRGTAPSIQQDASVPNAAASVMLMDRTAVTQDFDRPTLVRFRWSFQLMYAVHSCAERGGTGSVREPIFTGK